MKHITVKLTEAQLRHLLRQLDLENEFEYRLSNKLAKALNSQG